MRTFNSQGNNHKDGAILTMHRNKFGHEYDILIGGGVILEKIISKHCSGSCAKSQV